MNHEPGQRDRNLLFAILAVQLFRVPPARLMEVAASWAVDPSRDLAERLVEANLLQPEDRDLIWSLVDKTVEAHVGDVVAALETFGGTDALNDTRTGSILVTGRDVKVEMPRATPVRLELGDMLGVPETPGRYSQGPEFARGGMGRVFLVHDEYLGRDVALKELLPVQKQATELPTPTPVRQAVQLTARFLQEARITGQLEHPSIVPVYELGHRPDGSLYYTMKLVRGRTLSEALKNAGDLTARLQLLPHFVDLCQAIAYAHSRGVLHRDLKPSNVMVGEFGETVVIDWGLAKAKNQPDVHADPLSAILRLGRQGELLELDKTQYGQVLGTPHYMAPEQAAGAIDHVDERSDVYALGAILYEILTGRPPFQGKSAKEVLNQVVSEHPGAILDEEPDTPPEIVAICSRAINRDAAQRYQSAKELADDIQRYLSGALVSAYRYRFSEHLKRYIREHRAMLSAAAAALVILLAVGAYYNVRLYRARETERALRIETQETNKKLEWEFYSSALVEAKSNIDKANQWKATQVLYRLPRHLRGWEWGRLLLESNPALYAVADDPMRGMTGMPMRAIFGPDNRHVLVAHDFGGVKTIFDIAKGDTIYISEVDRFQGMPWCNGFAADLNAITLGEDETNVVLFDYLNDKILARYSIESGWLSSFVLSRDERVAAGYRMGPDKLSREIILWEAATGKEIRRFPMARAADPPFDLEYWGSFHEPPYGIVLGFLEDNRHLLCTDDNVVLLDTETGERTPLGRSLNGRAAFAREAGKVAAYTPDGDVEVWNVVTRELDHRVPVGLFGFRNVDITPDARLIGFAAGNHLYLWDVASGEFIRDEITDSNGTESLSFSPNSRCALTYGNEMTLRFWDLTNDRKRQTVPFPSLPVRNAEDEVNHDTWPKRPYAYDAAVSTLARGDDEGWIRTWQVPSFALKDEWKAHEGVLTALAFSPDGTIVYTGANDGTAKAWKIESNALLWTVSVEDKEPVFAIGCSQDGSRVAIGFGEDTSVNNGVNPSRIVDARTGETQLELDDGIRKTTLLAFTPDGKRIMSGSWGRYGTNEICVRFHDASDGTVLPYTVNAIGWPYRAIPIPDKSQVLILGTSFEPLLWDLERNREIYRVQRYDVTQIAVHPDGRRFVGRSRGQAVVFALEDGRPLLALEKCIGLPTFSDDGRVLITRAPDFQMQVLPTDDWTMSNETERSGLALQALQKLLELEVNARDSQRVAR